MAYRATRVYLASWHHAIPIYSPSIDAFYQDAKFHAYTIWLFTQSDIKTIILPKTFFGILSAVSSPAFDMSPVPLLSVLARIPVVALWCWMNLLPFTIDNQRQSLAILEDTINKPWRPLPSSRLTPHSAKLLIHILYPVTLITSYQLGGLKQSITLVLLGYWYNDFGGSDKSLCLRNIINGAGFVCYASGAMEVAYGSHFTWNTPLTVWLIIVGLVVTSSVHTQDMYDQIGDRARRRRTAPLVWGDRTSRWTIGVSVTFWRCICPIMWGSGLGSVACISLGCIVTSRTLMKRSVKEDKSTFYLWNLWMVALYSLPLFKLLS